MDLRFVDLPGTWQHFSIPIEELSEGLFVDGIGFDGSSIRGFQHIHESDMLLMPDATSAFIDPVLEVKTIDIICDVVEPGTRTPYTRDPRTSPRREHSSDDRHRRIAYGSGDEFYILNALRFDQAALRLLLHRFRGRHLELRRERHAEPRPSAALQGGLLPGPAGRPAPGPALQDGPRAHRVRHRGRGASPRGGHRGSDGDRHPLRHDGRDRGQVLNTSSHQERRGEDGNVVT